MTRAAARRRVNRALDRAAARAEQDSRRRTPRSKAPNTARPKETHRVG